MKTLRVDVRGLPRPQGSMRAVANKNGQVGLKYPPAVYAWRAQVQQALTDALDGEVRFAGPVILRLGFDLPRPAGHFGTGRNSERLAPRAPHYPTVAPDLDKLIRAICDAATDAGVWKDDAQVVHLIAHKRYGPSQPGVLIQVQEAI